MAEESMNEVTPATMQFVVKVDDNFHYMDESERYTLGVFSDCKSAVAACQRLVDQSLLECYEPGCTAESLFGRYAMFGEDPFVLPPDGKGCDFSAWDYARKRAAELCGNRAGEEGRVRLHEG